MVQLSLKYTAEEGRGSLSTKFHIGEDFGA